MNEYSGRIRQAEADLRKAKILFEKKEHDGVASNCQQAIEKSLKAIVIKEEQILVKVHDLVLLGKRAKLPNDLLNEMKNLSGLYIESRYGIVGDIIPAEKFKEKDSIEFLKITEEVLKWVKKKI